MAAGLGFKDFTTGEVLTAADVDGYLMQGIWVFASAAARDAAVTSPQEGNACYLKDTNEVLTYSGSAWVAVGGGGGAFTSISSITPSGATQSFTSIASTYTHLCLVFQGVYASSDNQSLSLTLNDIATSTYSYARIYDSAGTYGSSNAYATSSIAMAGVTDSATATNGAAGVIWFYNYATAGAKGVDWKLAYNRSSAGSFFVMGEGFNTTSSAINKISLTVGAGTFSGGTMQLYGVK
jgi:hypothetical protein